MVLFSMDGSETKPESMKPVFLKAGIPLAITAAGYIFVKLFVKRDSSNHASLPDNNQVNSLETNSEPSSSYVKNEEDFYVAEALQIRFKNDQEDEILRLRAQLKELEKRESDIKMQFFHYRELKEKESLLVEVKNTLLAEKANVELIQREVSSMEAANKRLEDSVIQYIRSLEQIQGLESQNRMLRMKVKRLRRRSRAQSGVIKEKNLKISGAQKEVLRSLDELGTKANVVNLLEEEVTRLKLTVDELQQQNKELSEKLNSIPKIEHGGVTITIQDYKQLLHEYENLQASRKAEIKELIFLRWSAACLRHELLRYQNHTPQEQDHESKTLMEIMHLQEDEHLNNGTEGLTLTPDNGGDSDSGFCERNAGTDHRVGSRRKNILNRLKRLVDGNEKMKGKSEEREKNEVTCLGRHSVSDRAEEDGIDPARKSCSSV